MRHDGHSYTDQGVVKLPATDHYARPQSRLGGHFERFRYFFLLIKKFGGSDCWLLFVPTRDLQRSAVHGYFKANRRNILHHEEEYCNEVVATPSKSTNRDTGEIENKAFVNR